MDLLLHIWDIVELVQAVRAVGKLKTLPPEQDPERICTGPEL